MRVLFLTPQLPFPAISGGLFKTFKMLEHLTKCHDITFGCFLKDEDQKHSLAFDGHFKIKKQFKLPLKKERTALNFALSLLKGIPLSVYRNESKEFKHWVDLVSKDVDVIFIDHFLMFQYVPADFKGRVLFHEHNAENVMWYRYSEEVTGIKKILLRFEASRIRKYEQIAIQRSSIVFAAPNDIEELKKFAPSGDYKVTYHLGDDTLLLEPFISFRDRKNEILYIGTLTWEANRTGLQWFLETMWENLLLKKPETKLIVIGKRFEGDFSKWLNHPSIIWKGFVDDLRPYYSTAKVFISPLKFGSGIKVKNINSLYRGLPVVTTDIGVEGLVIEKDIHLKIENDESAFVNAVVCLLDDENEWTQMAYKSHHYAKTNFSWSALLEDIEQEVRK